MIRFAVTMLALSSGLNAFAYKDQNPDNPWSSCPPGFSRDVFGTCQPDYTFPGGVGHDDDGTPHGGTPHKLRHTCYATDRRGVVFHGSSRHLSLAQDRALSACEDRSARPRSSRLYSCN